MNTTWTRLALFAVLACTPLAASTDLEPPELGRYFKWGPLRVRPGITVSNLGYDDNILSSSSDPIDDYTATVGPTLKGLVLFGHRAFLTFDERYEYTLYADNDDQNFHNQKGKARLTVPLRRMGFFVDGILNRTRERPVDLQDIRPERDRDTLGFGVILVPRWRTEIEIGHRQTAWSYDDPDEQPGMATISRRLDRDEQTTSLEIAYRLLGRTRLTFDVYVEDTEFDALESAGKDSSEWSAMPGVDFGLGGKLSGSARAGWTVIDPDDPDLPTFDELVGNAELKFRPGARTSLHLDILREPGFTVSGDNIYFLNTRFGLRAVYYINRLLGVESGGQLGKLTFPGSTELLQREDDLDSYEAGVRLRLPQDALGRRIEYSLKLKRVRSRSTLPSQNFSHTTFGFGASLGF